MNRRDFTKVVAGTLSLCGCNDVISAVSKKFGQDIPKNLTPAQDEDIDKDFHFLSRTTYGLWPGELEKLKTIGREAWLEWQFKPMAINDTLCDLRARRFETIHHHFSMCYEYRKKVLRSEMVKHTLLRAIYSRRQLFEVMVGFWTDHFNIHIEKSDCIYLKATDDREVIRKHALGNFRDLVHASAISPAMLVYLDGKSNKKEKAQDIPNENYARELLELHTLGVHGGYSQKDVFEVARALTGWRYNRRKVFFNKNLHDQGSKKILGQVLPANGGKEDLQLVLDIVCNHPSTAAYICLKLAKRFISPTPPKSIVEKMSQVFIDTKGDIKSVLRCLFLSEEFYQPETVAQKFKRPFHFIVSCLRFLGADTYADKPQINYLERMGQVPFQYPTPDGYPDEMQPWLGTLLWRWNFAHAATANKIRGTRIRLKKLLSSLSIDDKKDTHKLVAHFIGRLPSKEEQQIFTDYMQQKDMKKMANQQEFVGLILCSPAFQRY
ncbi:DUF1800 domain-containing protein [Candidatus Uabimicrobium sp. HlEnr_7]|uniref:DUF1800 domain-containing protein n=1 Tax=Candidatus Uabimicrobium helgolandensis TaxID=3095367 RepID=UPI0035582BFD